jgi:hypothetical protein
LNVRHIYVHHRCDQAITVFQDSISFAAVVRRRYSKAFGLDDGLDKPQYRWVVIRHQDLSFGFFGIFQGKTVARFYFRIF